MKTNCLQKWFAVLVFSASTATLLATTDYYVATTGSDGAGVNGSAGQPWKTVAYAASRVTGTDSVIHVGPGTFAETARVNLNPGVSLDGAGEDLTVITTAATLSGTLTSGTGQAGSLIYLNTSGTVAVNGNQTLSNFTVNGKTQLAWFGIYIRARNNVTVHDVTGKDCYNAALYAEGPGISPAPTWPALPPNSALLSNLQVYNSTFKNSGYVPPNSGWGYGNLGVHWLRDSSIHHCSFDTTEFGGFNIKSDWGINVSIHHCDMQLAPQWPDSSRGKGYGLEFLQLDSSEIYDNTTNGGISVNVSNCKLHHNTVIYPAGEGKTQGFEFSARSSQLFSNYIEGAKPAVAMWGSSYTDNTIYHNVIRNCVGGIFISADGASALNHLNIYNNTLDGCTELWYLSSIGVRVTSSTATLNDLRIVNNIIVNNVGDGSDRGAIILSGTNGHSTVLASNITNTMIRNNVFYNNYAMDVKDWGAVGTTSTNNIVANPGFAGGSGCPSPYYLLSATSPALATGTNVGIPYLGSYPDRGAFVQNRSFVSGSGARVEAEMNYSVVADAGANPIGIGNLTVDSYKSIGFHDNGDTLRVHFYVPADGNYSLWARVRSGDVNGPTTYWPVANNRYVYKIDSFVPVTLTGDPGSVSAYDAPGGGVYLGTMKSGSVYLTQGLHSLEVKDNSAWTFMDYFELHQP